MVDSVKKIQAIPILPPYMQYKLSLIHISIRVQASNYGIKGIFFLPDSRISEIHHRASLRQGVTFDNRIAGQLFVVDACLLYTSRCV